MASDYSIKESVKIITVGKPLQKINFQVRHPENVSHILGIAVTCSLIPDVLPPPIITYDSMGNPIIISSPDKGTTAGYLSLAVPQKGDVIFGEDVKLDANDYTDLTEKNITGAPFDISRRSKYDPYLKTFIPIDKSVLEGFYEEVYSPSAFPMPGMPIYKVTLYLRYKVISINPTNKKP